MLLQHVSPEYGTVNEIATLDRYYHTIKNHNGAILHTTCLLPIAIIVFDNINFQTDTLYKGNFWKPHFK